VSPDPHSSSPPPAESTAVLLAQVRAGDDPARERLARRYLPILQTWASGRLPSRARSLGDTDDLVQVTLMRALDAVRDFHTAREGAFLSYLRSILLNALRDQLRRAAVRAADPVDETIVDRAPSVIEEVMGREVVERYEAGLAELPETQREAVMLRLEFGFSHQEIADAVGSPSANSARMLVSRGLVRLAEWMSEHRA
jgi:RNA polymerase sigma factor (sigma-70 family)